MKRKLFCTLLVSLLLFSGCAATDQVSRQQPVASAEYYSQQEKERFDYSVQQAEKKIEATKDELKRTSVMIYQQNGTVIESNNIAKIEYLNWGVIDITLGETVYRTHMSNVTFIIEP